MNGWNEINDEKELILKLFNTGHLNVPERGNLPEGKVRASVASEVIKESLNSLGWFPGSHQLPVGDAGGQYMQLELKPDSRTLIHHNFEYSYLRYKHTSIEFENSDIAIKVYLQSCEKEGLDGISIDWKL